MNGIQPSLRRAPLAINGPADSDLRIREINHRWLNDLQLITSLLSLQAKRTRSAEAREALRDTADRVSILARSRASLQNPRHQSLEEALRQVCEALQSQAGPRAIMMSLEVGALANALPYNKVTTLALIVNELATNAIKHAFKERDSGRVKIKVQQNEDRHLVITVEDDGCPLPEPDGSNREGFGMSLIRKLTDSIGGILIRPEGSKSFQIRMPLSQN